MVTFYIVLCIWSGENQVAVLVKRVFLNAKAIIYFRFLEKLVEQLHRSVDLLRAIEMDADQVLEG